MVDNIKISLENFDFLEDSNIVINNITVIKGFDKALNNYSDNIRNYGAVKNDNGKYIFKC